MFAGVFPVPFVKTTYLSVSYCRKTRPNQTPEPAPVSCLRVRLVESPAWLALDVRRRKMNTPDPTEIVERPPAFWGRLSITVPVIAIVGGFAFMFLSGAGRGVGGDMAGPFVFGIVCLVAGGLCVASFGFAVCALIKREAPVWPAVVGLVVNLPFVLYGILMLGWRFLR